MWDERYATSEYVFGKAPSAFIVAHKDWLKPGQTALAVADGEGRNGVYMAAQGLDVHAVDGSPNAIAKARALAAEHGVTMRHEQVDLLAWDWPEAEYDLVVGIFIQFTGPADRETMFEGMKKALKPGGIMLLHGYTPRQIEYKTGGPPFVENMYTGDLLRSAFSDFDILEIEEYEAVINEGRGHSGKSALVDMVARKPT
ncbi:MAG TPA: class I SAM-dependent methyltransferase [Devosiaceae bacterium]